MIQNVIKKIDKISNVIGSLAAFFLILLVGLIAFNVIGRHWFNASSIAIEELSWHLYSAVFLLGLSYALCHSAHVRVDILYDNYSSKTKAWVDITGTLLFLLPTCAVIMWSGYLFAMEAWHVQEQSQDPGGLAFRWVIKSVIPLSYGFLLISGVSMFLKKILLLSQLITNKGTSK